MRFGNLIKCYCVLIMLLYYKLNKIFYCFLFMKDLFVIQREKEKVFDNKKGF